MISSESGCRQPDGGALFDNTTVDVEGKTPCDDYLLRTAASVNTFPGFMTLYERGRERLRTQGKVSLPKLAKGDELKLLGIFPEQRFITQPPPRYTDGDVVKTLEQFGIGGPSTYARPNRLPSRSAITSPRSRGSSQPTELGIRPNDLLVQHFPVSSTSSSRRPGERAGRHRPQRARWPDVIGTLYAPFEKDLQKRGQDGGEVKLAEETTARTAPVRQALVIKDGALRQVRRPAAATPTVSSRSLTRLRPASRCPECGQGP
jgi:DNA topoisomerase-1